MEENVKAIVKGKDAKDLSNFKANFATELLKCTKLTSSKLVSREVTKDTRAVSAQQSGSPSAHPSSGKQCTMRAPKETSTSPGAKPTKQPETTNTSPPGSKTSNQPATTNIPPPSIKPTNTQPPKGPELTKNPPPPSPPTPSTPSPPLSRVLARRGRSAEIERPDRLPATYSSEV